MTPPTHRATHRATHRGRRHPHDREPSVTASDYATDFARTVDLEPDGTALVLVDLQLASASRRHGLGRLLEESGRQDSGRWRFDRLEQVVVPNVARLLDDFRQRGAPVVHVHLGSRTGDFSDVPAYLRSLAQRTDNRVGAPNHASLPELAPIEGEPVVTKTTASAFMSSDLDDVLRRLGARALLVVGVSTNTCVESTARDAADLGYGTVLVHDGCAGPAADLHEATLVNFARLFGDVAGTDEVIGRLARR